MSGLYGAGAYGVGPYGKAIQVPFGGRGAFGFSGRARANVQPHFRPRVGSWSFAGRARTSNTLRAKGFAGAALWAGFGGQGVQIEPGPFRASWTAGGEAWWVLDPGDDETVHVKAAPWSMRGAVAWRASLRATGFAGAERETGRARANVQVHARGFGGGTSFGGRSKALSLQPVKPLRSGSRFDAHQPHAVVTFRARRLRGAFRFAGRARFGIRPVLRVRGAFRFGGRAVTPMRMGSAFLAGAGRFAGRAFVSYSWSDLTAPGRYPPTVWTGAPGLPDTWTPAPGPGGAAWGTITGPEGPWIEIDPAGGGWEPVE